MPNGERLTLNPVSESLSNAPLELVGSDGITLITEEYPAPERDSLFAPSADTEGDPLVQHRYKNREITLALRVLEPHDPASTNLATNPKAVVDTTGWTNAGLTSMTSAALPSLLGSIGADTGLRVQGNAGSGFAYTTATVAAGQSYTFSAWVYLAANAATGVRVRVDNSAAATQVTSATLSAVATWTRLNITVVGSASTPFRFGLEQVGAGTVDAYLTGVLVEQSATLTNYFDGHTAGCSWTGTANSSTSTRPASGGPRYKAILRDLQQGVARFNAEQGGTLRRIDPYGDTIVFDVVGAEIAIPQHRRSMIMQSTEPTLKLTCKPFGRGPIAIGAQTSVIASGAATQTLITNVKGDVPALATITATNGAAADQLSFIWGVQSKNYSSASTAALYYEAEAMTPLAATAVFVNGDDSGGHCLRNATVTTTYQPLMSTKLSGGSHLSHIGTFTVWARVQLTGGGSGTGTVAFQWAEGDFQRRTTNAGVNLSSSLTAHWVLVNLGQVTLHESSIGTQQWEGRILATSTSTNAAVLIDYIMLIPADEGSGVVTAGTQPPVPTPDLGQDGFDQTAGALNGKTASVGGLWATSGTNATDFQVDATNHVLTHSSTVADSAGAGRFALLSTSVAGTLVQADVKFGPSPVPQVGIVARYVDANNWFMAWLEPNTVLGSGYSFYVRKKVAGTITQLSSSGAPNHDEIVGGTTGQFLTLRLIASANGHWSADTFSPGGLSTPYFLGFDSDLAPGGALATGKFGLYSALTTAGTNVRTIDNFIAATDVADAAIFASQSLELQHDRVLRADSLGTVWVRPNSYEGDYLLLPAAGPDNRVTRVIMKASRGISATIPDSSVADTLSTSITYTPRYLVIPS